jgi:hypothetical protein
MTATLEKPGAPTTPKTDPLESNYRQVCLSILGLGGLFLIVAVVSYVLYRTRDVNAAPYVLWGLALCSVCLVAGLVGLLAQGGGGPETRTRGERARVLILLVVGAAGLATAVLGLALPFAYRQIFGEPFKVWQKHLGTVCLVLAVIFAGMVVLFAGLTLARGYLASHPNLRRVVYGYNAVVGTALLTCILVLVNFLPYIQVPPFKYLSQTYDWTTSKIFSLSDESKAILASLQEPVEVYVLLNPDRDRVAPEVETLLNNCRSVTSRVHWRVVARDFNIEELRELDKKYQLPDSTGLLVVYGTEPKTTSEFIRRSDLVENQDTSPTEQRFLFKGESALMNAISYLSQGKKKSVVYFTKGHGEAEFDGLPGREGERSISMLKEELDKRNYEVRSLKLDIDTNSIPDDADAVVVAGPTRPLGDNQVKALRDYLQGAGGSKKKGRLIALLDPVIKGGSMEPSGLEALLAENNVKLGKDRLLAAGIRNPLDVVVIADPESNNPIAKAFVQGGRATPFLFENARTVEPLPGNPSAPGGLRAETVLFTVPDYYVWAETNLEASPQAAADEVRNNREKLRQKVSRVPLSVAVAVTEGGTPPPPIPGHESLAKEGQPRLIVVGDSAWVTNRFLAGRDGRDSVDLFASCLAWLREKPNLGSGAAGKERNQFHLTVPPDGGWRLVLLPIVLLLLTVCLAGTGIWVVRRR